VEYDLGNLTLEYDFENVSLLSSSSYFDYSAGNIKEFFGTRLFSDLDSSAFIQEIRMHSNNGGPFQWTAGGFYKDIEQDIVQDATELIGPTGVVGQNDNNTSYALFADGTIYFAVDWEFSAGLRYFNETRETFDISGLIPPDVNSNDFDAISPRFNLAWHPTENSTVYANAAKGFRSGLNQGSTPTFFAQLLGVTIPPAAEDEDLWAYELGYKGLFQDGRLRFEAAAYFNDWTNLQVSVPVIIGVLNSVVNAGSAESPGIEFALDYSATDSLNVGLSAGWNDAKITEDLIIDSADPGMPGVTVPVVVFTDGDRINNAPEWTANGWLNYFWPVGSAYEGVFYLGAQYTSERINRAGGFVDTSDSLFKVDTRIGIRSDRWAAFLFCDNCTDENGAVFPSFGPTLPESSRFRPQTIGLNLQVFY
jgi:outer membrane receptor protein involved in Fe transport